MTNVADPLGGSYYVEALTAEIERQALEYFRRIEEYGGVIEAIEAGFFQREIADASYRYQRSLESKDRIVVGVNAFEREESSDDLALLKIGREVELGQAREVAALRGERDGAAVEAALAALETRVPVGCERDAGADRCVPGVRDPGRNRRRDGRRVRPLRGARVVLRPSFQAVAPAVDKKHA